MNVDKISKKIERELSKLAKTKLRKTNMRKIRLLSKANKDIVNAAKYFSKMCRDREFCFDILIELMNRYRPDDVISWLQERILSDSGSALDIDIQRVAADLSIERKRQVEKPLNALLRKLILLFRIKRE